MKERVTQEEASYSKKMGANLREARLKRNLTPGELAREKNFQFQHVINVEQGIEMPSGELVIAYHDLCEVDIYSTFIRPAYEMDLNSSPNSETSLDDIKKEIKSTKEDLLAAIKKVRPQAFEV